MKHVAFGGRLVMLGFGSIGQGVLPLILRHIDLPRDRISILSGDTRGQDIAAEYGVPFTILPLNRDNYRDVLSQRVGPGDFLLNLSVDVSSVALIGFAGERGALYLDTCIEPWAGGYTDPSLTPSQRSNYALRESALALAGGEGPTAVLTHGANPGLVSHFVKATTTAPMMTTSTKMTIGSRRMRARGAEMSSCPLMNLRYRHPPKSGSSERDFARTRTMIRS